MSELVSWLDQFEPWRILVIAADILIVTFIIYRIILLVRGTGAAYILTGLLVVAGVYLVAREVRLTTVSWLLDHVLSYVILIVIIVFQADIRRGLMRVGRRMFPFTRASVAASDVEEVVQACEMMASSRTGALVVFEREADVEQFIEKGTPIEARVSKMLLHNVFAPWPDNPLHDGAVVVKDNWINQVAAVLPLSMNQELDEALGTRHRAAVGITEETDALAVVVSEQRGVISLCVGGRIRTGLTGEQLRRELLARLAVPEGRWSLMSRIVKRFEPAAPKAEGVLNGQIPDDPSPDERGGSAPAGGE